MRTLTIATLNLRGGQARWQERAPLVIEQLVELRPDIIGFQEVDVLLDQGNWLCQRFNNRSWGRGRDVREYRIHHVSNPRERVWMEALAIMTHLPLLEHEGFDYLIRDRVAHRLRLDLGDGLRLDFYNTHLFHEQDPAGGEIRLEQVRKLLPWIARRSRGVPQVLVGDFNAFPMTPAIKKMKERFSSAHELVHGDEPEDTIWTPLRTAEVGWRPSVGMVVDYIFVAGGVRAKDAWVTFDRSHAEDDTLSASDHYGLAATVSIG